MSINGITNLNRYAAMQMTQTQVQNQASASTTAAFKISGTPKIGSQTKKTSSLDGLAERIKNIPNLEQYEDLIQRFLSGESELEVMGEGHKPLTEDQIALRGLMRELRRTDTRSMSQVAADMQQASKNFINYWQSNGNSGPPPARAYSADGSFQIFNSQDERNEHLKKNTMSLLETMMSVIKAGKNSGVDVQV